MARRAFNESARNFRALSVMRRGWRREALRLIPRASSATVCDQVATVLFSVASLAWVADAATSPNASASNETTTGALWRGAGRLRGLLVLTLFVAITLLARV